MSKQGNRFAEAVHDAITRGEWETFYRVCGEMFPDPPLNRTPPADPRFDEQGNPGLITPEQAVKLMADSLPVSEPGQYTPHNPVAVNEPVYRTAEEVAEAITRTWLPYEPHKSYIYRSVLEHLSRYRPESERLMDWVQRNHWWVGWNSVLQSYECYYGRESYLGRSMTEAIRAAMAAEKEVKKSNTGPDQQGTLDAINRESGGPRLQGEKE